MWPYQRKQAEQCLQLSCFSCCLMFESVDKLLNSNHSNKGYHYLGCWNKDSWAAILINAINLIQLNFIVRKQQIREIFNSASKVNCVCFGFALLYSVIGQQNWRHFFNQWDSKPIAIATCSRIFPRFAPANCLVFWLAHCAFCISCDWSELLLWYWFYDIQLKTALWEYFSPWFPVLSGNTES